jgi:two-component system LytT family response regulator
METAAAHREDKLSVMIVDDEPAARRTLRECCDREHDLLLIGEYGDSETALTAIREAPPDILLLDIQVRPLTGVALARALNPTLLPLIVFVTAYDEFALDAFELSAVDYVLKPFSDDRVHHALDRVRRRHRVETLAQRQTGLSNALDKLERSATTWRQAPPRIIAEAAGRMHVIDAHLIEMVQSNRNYVKLTVGRNTFSARNTLMGAQEMLITEPMLKISRSCLLNLRHVREISHTPRGDIIAVLAGGATITSSERFRESVRSRLEKMQMSWRKT